MNKTYVKVIIREIKDSFGRFAAIFGIVALGVGFLAGLLTTTPDMHLTADEYYDRNNMADIFIKSTMGLTKEDLDIVTTMEEIEQIMPAFVVDVLMNSSKKDIYETRVYGLPLNKNEKNINRLELLEGRMPKYKYECLVERGGTYLKDIPIGSKLIVSDENEDVDEIFTVKEFTVVGIVGNSFHFTKEREISNVGAGKLSAIIYMDEKAYALETYTDFYMTLKGAKSMDTFSAQYELVMEEMVERLKELGRGRIQVRYDEILIVANDQLDDGKKKYTEAKVQVDTELSKAWKKIKDGKIELEDGLKEIEDGRLELKDAKLTLKQKTRDAKIMIEDVKKELNNAYIELKDGENKLGEAKVELDNGYKEYENGLREYYDAREELEAGQREFDKGEQEYLQGLKEIADAKKEITKGERQLDTVKEELDLAEKELNRGKEEINLRKSQIDQAALQYGFPSAKEFIYVIEQDTSGVISGLTGVRELQNGWYAIIQAEEKIEYGFKELEMGKGEYLKGRSKLQDTKNEIKKADRDLVDAKKEIEKSRKELENGWKELNKGRLELDNAKIKLSDGYKEYNDGLKEINDGWKEYEDGLREVEDAEKTLQEEVVSANRRIKDAEKDLVKGQLDYNKGVVEFKDGEKEYYKAKREAEDELSHAREEIEDAQEEIDDIEFPKWYIFDRNSNMSFASYVINAEKVAAIANVFPVFFFLIASLVALTTMTRMVEEERVQIGTLKALGYSRGLIISKYLIYCGLASLLGSIAGLFIGFKIIPIVIYNAYGVMYHLPYFIADINIKIAMLTSGMVILSTMATTTIVCNQALKEKPATLMLPRVPKAGKRILLERIDFIWSKLSFNHKATARNLFRYKKHFLMTVTGIAGCTALLVTGFGLRDAIADVADIQFSDIFKYDLQIGLEDKLKYSNIEKIINNPQLFKNSIGIFSDEGNLILGKKNISAKIFIPVDTDEFTNFIDLRDRKSKKKISFDDSSVIISEKASVEFGLSLGDKFVLEDSNGVKSELLVTDVTENYIGNYVFLNKMDYVRGFKNNLDVNTILMRTGLTDSSEQDALISSLLENENILHAEFVTQSRVTFDNLLTSINFIVIVIIILSGSLAFIVLYNLTNININERKKELATLKVLGYHNEEVSIYIFRETNILTIIGILVGLPLGWGLLRFIILNVENPEFMFGREIKAFSYIISALITLVFSMIVNAFMNKKLRNIEMVDSMKANE